MHVGTIVYGVMYNTCFEMDTAGNVVRDVITYFLVCYMKMCAFFLLFFPTSVKDVKRFVIFAGSINIFAELTTLVTLRISRFASPLRKPNVMQKDARN